MSRGIKNTAAVLVLALGLCVALPVPEAGAMIDGVTGPAFSFTAEADTLITADGGSWLFWGFRNNNATGRAQYPGPTMIVQEGDSVTVTLANNIQEPVSLVFPGQTGVVAVGGQAGLLARQAAPSSALVPEGEKTVTYSFTASRPGTYLYYSGSHPELQVEMGLVGALIVRPALGPDHAYDSADTRFDREYLFVLSDLDPYVHMNVEFGAPVPMVNADREAKYWLINGRVAPDTMQPAFSEWLPTQPYDSMPRMHPGERLLMRVVNLGRDLHPFHHHGNHTRVLAHDGRLLQSPGGAGADLAYETFTIQAVPGETYDAIFTWTGYKLGWDAYGPIKADCVDADNDGYDDSLATFCHDAACSDLTSNETGAAGADGFDDATWEYCADHGAPLPTVLPQAQEVTFGGFWSGGPFLGDVPLGGLPPGQGGLNPTGAFTYMWHSHTEKELTNFDLFPGGMMTMLFVEAFGVPIP